MKLSLQSMAQCAATLLELRVVQAKQKSSAYQRRQSLKDALSTYETYTDANPELLMHECLWRYLDQTINVNKIRSGGGGAGVASESGETLAEPGTPARGTAPMLADEGKSARKRKIDSAPPSTPKIGKRFEPERFASSKQSAWPYGLPARHDRTKTPSR